MSELHQIFLKNSGECSQNRAIDFWEIDFPFLLHFIKGFDKAVLQGENESEYFLFFSEWRTSFKVWWPYKYSQYYLILI